MEWNHGMESWNHGIMEYRIQITEIIEPYFCVIIHPRTFKTEQFLVVSL
jgi:hypothetical protein